MLKAEKFSHVTCLDSPHDSAHIDQRSTEGTNHKQVKLTSGNFKSSIPFTVSDIQCSSFMSHIIVYFVFKSRVLTHSGLEECLNNNKTLFQTAKKKGMHA